MLLKRAFFIAEKQDKLAIADLKNGKVSFKQKPILLEKLSETLQEIVKFREMIEQRVEKQEPPLQSIPNEHLPLIAKLGHESDKTLAALAKHIQQELMLPLEDDDEDKAASAKTILPLEVIDQAIKSTLFRNNYGLDALNGSRAPAAVCIWRWEVLQHNRDWLPKSAREKLEARIQERAQAKEHLRQMFAALSQAERDAILDPKGTNRANNVQDPSSRPAELPLTNKSENEIAGFTSPAKSVKAQDEENGTSNNGPGRPKRAKDPEKAAKEKERQEKKAAKAEKEKKAKDAQNKSRTLMAKFFSKPKAPIVSSKAGESSAGPSRPQNDFERTFKPFALKRGAVLAPPNWFKAPKRRKGKEVATENDSGVIVIDSDVETEKDVNDIVMQDVKASFVDVQSMSSQERLKDILASLPPPLDRSRIPRPRWKGTNSHLQTHNPCSIREYVAKLSEAEVAGDDNEVRTLLNQLQDRKLFPAKVFIYHEDARPGYFGTWTRSSRIIGPRRPFAKDVVEFDYGYDSGEEWEEEAMGDADDVLQDDDEDGDSDEADSDMDSWLVDDDEEPEALYDDHRDPSPPMLPDLPDMPPPPPPPKRKAAEPDKKAKKRKLVVPLVPFSKGPCWETMIGECEYEAFNQYRIQLFNDTPFPIDPFTFVSTCVEDYKASLKNSQPALVPCATVPNGSFLVPDLPDQTSLASSTLGPTPLTNAPINVIKKPVAPLKNPFPDAHLPYLLSKISELQMASLVLLVETIYQELKAHKVKKVAIEAKIREVGEKCKEKKIWIVRPTLKVCSASNQGLAKY
ncbi:hypothetical protein AN958_02401 [Leucoagaricus sp. SymC.cos]|nr:hypothetical protein AN958_02401 [Leucoagaricus sp. SymC.cos]